MSDDRLERIESKIDKLDDKICSVNVILAAQHESLKDHIRRTEILESAIVPLKRNDAMIVGALKLIIFIVAAAGALEGIVAVLNYLKH